MRHLTLALTFAVTLVDPGARAATRAAAPVAPAELPVRFEANAGQFDAEARFVARTETTALFLTASEAVFTLGEAPAVVRMRLAGASASPRLEGTGELPGRSNYLLGNDPNAWRAGAAYAGVRYTGVYPGVDLVYYGRDGRVEYDFVVAPGADPRAIRMRFSGAESVEIDAAGALVLATPAGHVRHEAPRVYQTGEGGVRRVVGRYAMLGDAEVGFELGAYDPSLPLVVDPVLAFASFVGGSGRDFGRSIAVAGSSVYVAGYTTSADFPTRGGIQPHGGGFDVFVAKMNESSPIPEYATYVGGSDTDIGLRVAVDAAGAAWVVGYTNSSDFPLRAPLVGESRNYDAFAFKLDATGSDLLFSTYFGGTSVDYGYGVALDAAGNAYVAGSTASSDLPTKGAFQPALGGQSDGFVAKIAASGSSLLYASFVGGEADEACVGGVAVDAAGSAYLTGYTRSIGFPLVDPIQPYFGIGDDLFVAKVAPSGAALVYSTCLGGEFDDQGLAIAVDAAGSAYVAGLTKSSVFPGKVAAPRHGEESDAFALKIAADGSAVVYSYVAQTTTDEASTGIAVDADGRAYVVGYSSSPTFPAVCPVLRPGSGVIDAYLQVLDPTGASLVYSTKLGGRSVDAAYGVAVDAAGDAFVTGSTASVDFPARAAFATSLAGAENAFLVRVSPEAGPAPPAMVSVKAAGSSAKFKVTIKGAGFQPGASIYLADDAEAWQTAKVKSSKIKLTGGAALEAKFAVGVPVRIRVVNPDGGLAFGSLVR
jgi:hypothetical protein